jgi:hypothetical protein
MTAAHNGVHSNGLHQASWRTLGQPGEGDHDQAGQRRKKDHQRARQPHAPIGQFLFEAGLQMVLVMLHRDDSCACVALNESAGDLVTGD